MEETEASVLAEGIKSIDSVLRRVDEINKRLVMAVIVAIICFSLTVL